jgi:hypothetical protein
LLPEQRKNGNNAFAAVVGTRFLPSDESHAQPEYNNPCRLCLVDR